MSHRALGDQFEVRGFHGGRLERKDAGDLFVGDRETADFFADGGPVHEVTYKASNPLVVEHGHQIRALIDATASEASRRGSSWHPHHTSAISDHLRAQGHDALVITPHAMRDDQPHEDWEAAHGSYGEPQSVILHPQRATIRPAP